MPAGGTVTIELSAAELPDSGEKSTRYARLSVLDTGTGISDEVRPHLFEPFFTTKPVGEGTGLGLATVYGIVEQHHGCIKVGSNAGTGTRVDVYLPIASGDVASLPQSRPRTEIPRGNETILVVEDEPAVRSVTVRILELLGYQVLQAGNGAEALEVLGAHAGAIDLLFTDIVMPVMDGRTLANRVRKILPAAGILFTSGYAFESSQDDSGQLNVPILDKPFTPEELAHAVRKVLDSVSLKPA